MVCSWREDFSVLRWYQCDRLGVFRRGRGRVVRWAGPEARSGLCHNPVLWQAATSARSSGTTMTAVISRAWRRREREKVKPLRTLFVRVVSRRKSQTWFTSLFGFRIPVRRQWPNEFRIVVQDFASKKSALNGCWFVEPWPGDDTSRSQATAIFLSIFISLPGLDWSEVFLTISRSIVIMSRNQG